MKEQVRAGLVGLAPLDPLARGLLWPSSTMAKSPGVAVAIITSVALGFAANATVFSVANGLLWGVLPVKDPGRMVMFSEGSSFSYPDYLDYRDQTTDVFEGGVAAHFPLIPASLGGTGEPERVWGQVVSGNYFPILGLKWRSAVPSFRRRPGDGPRPCGGAQPQSLAAALRRRRGHPRDAAWC